MVYKLCHALLSAHAHDFALEHPIKVFNNSYVSYNSSAIVIYLPLTVLSMILVCKIIMYL